MLNNPTAEEILMMVAGDLCPCGHLVVDHEEPDLDWRTGEFHQISGDCQHCGCRGEIG